MIKTLAFDFGASSGRAIIGEYRDGKITLNEIHRFENNPVKVNGVLYWDILRLFHEVKVGITKAKLAGGFDYLGIDTWGTDFGVIGQDGKMIQNPVHYRDHRTDNYEEIFDQISKEEIYSSTGIQFMKFNTIYQIKALISNEVEMLSHVKSILFIPDLLIYFLTEIMGVEYTVASTSQLLNAKSRNWDFDLIDKSGLPRELFNKINQPGTIVGNISDTICDELGVQKGQVVRVASHDTASAVIAVPTTEKDFIYISCGTWSLLGTETDEPIISELSHKYNFTNEGGYDGKIRFLKNIMGLWILQECRRQWKLEGQEYSYSELVALGQAAKPFTCFIDPDLEIFGSVCNMPEQIKAYCQKTNQHIPQTVGEIVRCINESLAMKYRMVAERLSECTAKGYPEIHVIGGGANSKMLCQMTANATNRKVIAGPVEATALGNVAIQLIASRQIENITEARLAIKNSCEIEEYLPCNSNQWDDGYKRFCSIILEKGE